MPKPTTLHMLPPMRVAAEGIIRRYGDHQVLDGVALTAERGTTLALTGASGRGKSTLLHILAGLDQPDGGRVCWDDHDVFAMPARRRERLRLKQVGLLRQDPWLDPRLTAMENCLIAGAFSGAQHLTERCRSLMAETGLDRCADVRGGSISGGQAVRVALVRALLSQPDLLFADEPTASLDSDTAAAIGDLLLRVTAAAGTTLVLATHDRDLAARCDQHLDLGSEVTT